MERKFKVVFNTTTGETLSYIGLGTPRMSLTEYYVKSPDGQEIVVLKDKVLSFVISELKEEEE